MLLEHRFVVEGVDMAWASIHETEDNSLGASRAFRSDCPSVGGHSHQRQQTESCIRTLQKTPPGQISRNGSRTISTPMVHRGYLNRLLGMDEFFGVENRMGQLSPGRLVHHRILFGTNGSQ